MNITTKAINFLPWFLISLGIMTIIDFRLGAEAEHLNAWAMLRHLFGGDRPNTLAVHKLGLYGAWNLLILANAVGGLILKFLVQGVGLISRSWVVAIVATALVLGTEARSAEFGTFQMGLTFGEIPILSGSFKPGVSLGYHINEYLYIGGVLQAKDYLKRDQESFNAKNTGISGLHKSRETVGERFLAQLRITPMKHLPYISTGWVWNNPDVETMEFHPQGDSQTWGEKLILAQTRPRGSGPGLGIGYQYDFSHRLSAYTDFTMAWFSDIAKPEFKLIEGTTTQQEALEKETPNLVKAYQDNFHNRYHVFNLGIAWNFAGYWNE